MSKIHAGVQFIKHNAYGPSQNQWLSIVDDRVFWCDSSKSALKHNRSIAMCEVSRLRPGKVSKTFKSKKCISIDTDHCFCVIGDRKSLSIEFISRKERDEWFTYLLFIYRHFVPAKRKTLFLEDATNILDDLLEDID